MRVRIKQPITIKKYKKSLMPMKPQDHWKLSSPQKHQVCEMLAKGFTPALVSQMMKEDHGVEISVNGIYNNYLKSPRWNPVIMRLRRQMESDIANHPMASKTVRLNYLQEATKEALKERVVKVSEHGIIKAKQPSIVASLIKEARAEVEGDQPIAVFNQNIDQSKKTLIAMIHESEYAQSKKAKKSSERGLEDEVIDIA